MYGIFSGSHSLVAGRHDATNERPAVPYPTPITFPAIEKLGISEPSPWIQGSAPDLFTKFASIRRPPDVTSEHLEALNVRYLASCRFEELLGESEDEPRYLPPISWLEPPSEDEDRDAENNSKRPLLYNGRPVPNHQDFYTRVKELYHSNDEAFRALNQLPSRDKHARPPIRLAHFRRFWEGIDNMSLYWDTSHDEYITTAPQEHKNDNDVSAAKSQDTHDLPVRESDTLSPAPALEESRKRTKQHHPNDHALTDTHHYYQSPPAHSLASSFGLHSLVHSGHHHDSKDPKSSCDANSPPPGTMYRGVRVGNGSSMPEQYRGDTVRAFVEPIAWSWGFNMATYRRPTNVSIRNLRCPVRVPVGVWRIPAERERARAGWLEGPVLGVSWRGEVDFEGKEGDQIRDLLREAGALFVLAQERAREGKKEVKPGEGKWWATVPRWGGGAGGEVGEGRGVGDEPVNKEQENEAEGHQERQAKRGRERKRFNPMEVWKVVRAGLGFWDPKVQWEAIGKNMGDEYDEVFLVSSLNHHISVLKLRIHALYLEYLESGVLPNPATVLVDWSIPTLQRTRWFDLFVAEDRAEAARGIWGVMAYLARPKGN